MRIGLVQIDCMESFNMRTYDEIKSRLNAIKMDLENPEKSHVSEMAIDAMGKYKKALEWVLNE